MGKPLSGTESPHVRIATWLALVEVAAAIVVVVVDLWVPTLVLLVVAGLGLAVRRSVPGTLGFHRPERPVALAGAMVGIALVWSGLTLTLTMPLLEHVIGERREVAGFAEVEWDLALALMLIALSWTLAAVGEETVYRGLVMTRARELLAGTGERIATLGAALLAATLFAAAHGEQGSVGVALTFVDALLFAAVRVRTGTLWAAVLLHGFLNTIGIVAYYLAGPVPELW